MGDHLVLLVDRLLTESTLESVLESRNGSMQATSSAVNDTEVDISLMKKVVNNDEKNPGKLVVCRICHDEDEDSNMETPCSCCGSLKLGCIIVYAHRRCVQKWCNEKGNTICEICHQQFKDGYTAPPPLFQFGRIPRSLRGNWEISRRDLNSTHLVSMVSTDQNLINSNYDQYSASTAGSLKCCGSVAIIFMVLLILSPTCLLMVIGIVLAIYSMVRAVTSIQRHRLQQREHPNASPDLSESNDET